MNTCRAPKCELSTHSKGLCKRHYAQEYAGRPFTYPGEPKTPASARTDCAVGTCKLARTQQGLCDEHHEYVMSLPEGRKCGLEDCREKVNSRRQCKRHYNRFIAGKPPESVSKPKPRRTPEEIADGSLYLLKIATPEVRRAALAQLTKIVLEESQ